MKLLISTNRNHNYNFKAAFETCGFFISFFEQNIYEIV